jgi:hypothetical protein
LGDGEYGRLYIRCEDFGVCRRAEIEGVEDMLVVVTGPVPARRRCK